MSLKAFHVFFITAAVLLSFGFGTWGFFEHQRTGAPVTILYTALGFVCGGGLIAYGLWFLRKLKGVDA